MQSQRQEPFFKPLNSDHQNFEFAISRNKGRQEQINNAETQSRDQDYAANGERLTSLHAKLHQEADRIRKWKNQTEHEIKQKDQKLKDATHSVENLRKSILDLQLKNESLSLNLQEEISKREDILQSVNATRSLCSVLKEHLTTAVDKVKSCEGEKTEIRYQEEEHKKQFLLLSKKFRELEVTSVEQQQSLKSRLTMVTEEGEKVRTEMKEKYEKAEEKLKQQLEKGEEKDLEIRDIRVEVQKNEDKIHALEQKIDQLTREKKTSEDEVVRSKSSYEELSTQFETLKSCKTGLEEQLCEQEAKVTELVRLKSDLQSQMDEGQHAHTQDLLRLQKEIQEQKQDLDQKHHKLLFLEADLEKTTSMLESSKSSKDMLIMDKTDLENKIRELEQKHTELLAQHTESCESISQMSATIVDLQTQLANRQQEVSVLMLQLNELRQHMSNMEEEKHQLEERVNLFENDISTKKAGLSSLKQELVNKEQEVIVLTEEMNQFKETFLAEKQSHEVTKAALQEIRDEVAFLTRQLAEKEKELKTCRTDNKALSSKNSKLEERYNQLSSVETELRNELAEVQAELVTQKEENESLMADKEQNVEEMNGQLQSKQKAASDLESKNKTLKADLTAKNKQNKELEKEIKSLKSKLTSGAKALEGKDKGLANLEEQLQQEATLNKEQEEKMVELNTHIKSLEQSVKEAEKKALEMKDFAEKRQAESESMSKQCEAQRAEMGNIMQNYKTENDKLVSKKEKEIETLNSQLQTLKDKRKKNDDEHVSKLKEEIQQLRQMISESGYQMESLLKNFGQKETEVSQLVKENVKKKEELKELQQQLESMYIKQTTTSVAQTSPFPNKTYQKPTSTNTRTEQTKAPPRTPKIQTAAELEVAKTPSYGRTPVAAMRTPSGASGMKTPQRSILKSLAANSSSKRRKVMFTNRDDDTNSEDSLAFEVMDVEDSKLAKSGTPLLLKPSPKPRTPKVPLQEGNKSSTLPLNRTPRGPPVDLSKKKKKPTDNEKENAGQLFHDDRECLVKGDSAKEKGDKSSSVRKAPSKVAGKFFKSSPKHRTQKPKGDMNWFENDDIFGFGVED